MLQDSRFSIARYENAADKFEDMVADIGASTNVPKSKLNGLVDKPSCLPITVKTFVADQVRRMFKSEKTVEKNSFLLFFLHV